MLQSWGNIITVLLLETFSGPISTYWWPWVTLKKSFRRFEFQYVKIAAYMEYFLYKNVSNKDSYIHDSYVLSVF